MVYFRLLDVRVLYARLAYDPTFLFAIVDSKQRSLQNASGFSHISAITISLTVYISEFMAHKTKSQKMQERADADRRVWEVFRPKLDAVQNLAEAYELSAETPPPNAPGRGYYSNLAFFLQCFGVPGGSSYAEKGLYLKLIARLDTTGILKPGAREKIESDLRQAMETEMPSS